MRELQTTKRKKKGFTLIELIIVIAVIGIIAAIAAPSLMGTKETFKAKADAKSAQTVGRAIEVLVISETIKSDASGTITIDTKPSLAATVAITGFTDTGDKVKTAVETALKDIASPQETNKDAYVITLTNGKVTSSETSKKD